LFQIQVSTAVEAVEEREVSAQTRLVPIIKTLKRVTAASGFSHPLLELQSTVQVAAVEALTPLAILLHLAAMAAAAMEALMGTVIMESRMAHQTLVEAVVAQPLGESLVRTAALVS
jgi:hypothetical protein